MPKKKFFTKKDLKKKKKRFSEDDKYRVCLDVMKRYGSSDKTLQAVLANYLVTPNMFLKWVAELNLQTQWEMVKLTAGERARIDLEELKKKGVILTKDKASYNRNFSKFLVICKHVSEGSTIDQACKVAKLGKASFYKFKNEHPVDVEKYWVSALDARDRLIIEHREAQKQELKIKFMDTLALKAAPYLEQSKSKKTEKVPVTVIDNNGNERVEIHERVVVDEKQKTKMPDTNALRLVGEFTELIQRKGMNVQVGDNKIYVLDEMTKEQIENKRKALEAEYAEILEEEQQQK